MSLLNWQPNQQMMPQQNYQFQNRLQTPQQFDWANSLSIGQQTPPLQGLTDFGGGGLNSATMTGVIPPTVPQQGWLAKGGWDSIGKGLNAVSNVANAYTGLKQLSQAKKMFNFQKDAWNLDYQNRAMEYNDRATARNAMLQRYQGENASQRRLVKENPNLGG
jgi:hypothetical protein